MGVEYKIKFNIPYGYAPSSLFGKLPSPIDEEMVAEIYNFKIEEGGFYFVDHLVNNEVASVAFRRLVNEALRYDHSVEIVEP